MTRAGRRKRNRVRREAPLSSDREQEVQAMALQLITPAAEYKPAPGTPLPNNMIDDTLSTLERAFQENPDDAQFYNRVGVEWSEKGLFDHARECFALAVELAPNCARYWYNLGTAFHSGGQPLQAVRYYESALNIAPEYSQAYQALKAARQDSAAPPVDVPAPSEMAGGEWAELLEEIKNLQESLKETPGLAGPHSPVADPHDATTAAPSAIAPVAMSPGVLARVSAGMVDMFVLQVIGVASVIGVNVLRSAIPPLNSMPTSGPALILGLLCAVAYFTVMTHRYGQTLGMQLMRLQIVDHVGNRPTLRSASLRTLGLVLDLATVGIGYFWMAFDSRRQALHDKLASTYVVGRKQDPGSALIWIAVLVVGNYLIYSGLLGPQFAA